MQWIVEAARDGNARVPLTLQSLLEFLDQEEQDLKWPEGIDPEMVETAYALNLTQVQRLADAGDAYEQYALASIGLRKFSMRHNAQDPAVARNWAQQAAAKDNPFGDFLLGKLALMDTDGRLNDGTTQAQAAFAKVA